MRAFPGSFPPATFQALSLTDLADTYELAARFLAMEADATRKAHP